MTAAHSDRQPEPVKLLDVIGLAEFEPDVWIPPSHVAARRGTMTVAELVHLDVIHGPRRADPGTYDAWTRVVRTVDPGFEFSDPPLRHSLQMNLAFAATADRPTAVLTGPSVIAGSRPGRIRLPRSAATHDMVRVGLQHHPLAATAALVWSGDLPRTLQQVLFDAAESVTFPGSAGQVEPELMAMGLSLIRLARPGRAAFADGSRILTARTAIIEGYATTGSGNYAAAGRCGELNDVDRGGLSGCRCRGGGLVSGALEHRQRADESWTTRLIACGQWRSAAACRSADPDLFFPISDSGPALKQAAEAKAICATCRVQRECLAFALRTGQVHGIWGGTTERERAAARRGTGPR